MAFTGQTTHYGLPQYVASDIPTILQDVNQAYRDIDAAIYEAKQASDTVATDLAVTNSNVAQNATDITTVDNKVTTNASNISSLTTRVGAAEQGITTLDSRLVTAEHDIDAVEAGLDEKATVASVTALTGRVATAESDIDAIEANVSALDGRLSTAESDIDAIEAKLYNNYVLIESVEQTFLTADGTKTNAQLYENLFNLVGGITAEQLDCDAFILTGVRIPTSSTSGNSVLKIEGTQPLMQKIPSSNFTLRCDARSYSPTGITNTHVNIGSTNNCYVYTHTTSGNFIADYSNNVPASGVELKLILEKYKKL